MSASATPPRRNFFRRLWPRKESLTVEQQIQRRTLLSFSGLLVFGIAAWKGWRWLTSQPGDLGIQEPVRKALNANEKIFQHTLSDGHLARTYPVSEVTRRVRVNGDIGLTSPGFDPATWKLEVTPAAGKKFYVDLEELKKLPKTEIIYDFKCIEGWSMITHWGGVRFKDFMNAYGLDKETSMGYAGMKTPDQRYYVGIDMPSALHPQTLLCYEMNGEPLPMNHGYPLRLIIPVKYGIKNLKRIGSLYFSNERPADYWFERGYDYYSGL